MTIIDANILIYATAADAPQHASSRRFTDPDPGRQRHRSARIGIPISIPRLKFRVGGAILFDANV